MPKARKGWICDTCKEQIENVKDGWVEWLTLRDDRNGRSPATGLRLVHHKPASPLEGDHGCQYNDEAEYKRRKASLSDLPLEYFLGDQGLMQLTEMLSDGSSPQRRCWR